MKILLAIPSKARAETLKKYTYQWLSLLSESVDWKIFVEPQDLGEYSGIQNLVPLPENNQGLGYAKSFIKSYAERHGYDFIFKLDDDIRGFTDFRKKRTPIETRWFIEKNLPLWLKCFENYKDLGAIAFPYSFEMYERKLWEPTKRVQTAYIVRTSMLYDNPNCSVFEDFATGLHIFVRGGRIMRYCMAGIDCGVKVGGGSGGHQSFDRRAKAELEVPILRSIYPPLDFRAVDKPWGIEPDIGSVKL